MNKVNFDETLKQPKVLSVLIAIVSKLSTKLHFFIPDNVCEHKTSCSVHVSNDFTWFFFNIYFDAFFLNYFEDTEIVWNV